MSRHPWHATNHCNTTFLEFMQREWSPGKVAGKAALEMLCFPLPTRCLQSCTKQAHAGGSNVQLASRCSRV